MPDKLGVIIPYRSNELRERHLEEVVPAVSNYLRNSRIVHSIVVVDQTDRSLFNRGKLCNIGVDYFVKNDPSITHFVFHDVDLIPIHADYSLTNLPVRLSIKITGGERDGGTVFFGGVTLVNKDTYYKVNGHSNVFFGWGGEDDDFKHRIDLSGIQTDMREYGEFVHLAHPPAKRDMKAHEWKMNRREEMRVGRFDFSVDGMSNLEYSIVSRNTRKLHTYLSVITDGSDIVRSNNSVYSGWKVGKYRKVVEDVTRRSDANQSLAVVICTMSNIDLLKSICSVCLKSTIVRQLIIVDNASIDNTVQHIESLADDRVTLVKNVKNEGCIKARNKGLVLSKSFYTLVIDDDQIPSEDTFSKYIEMLQYYDIVGCELQLMNFKTGLTEFGTHNSFTYVGAGGMCMRTSHWVKLGLFDEVFSPSYFEDPDIIERAKIHGFRIGYVRNSGIQHYPHHTLFRKDLGYSPPSIMSRNRKIFTSRYDGFETHVVKNTKVKILYVVDGDSIDDLLGNKDLLSGYRFNPNLDVAIFINSNNGPEMERVACVYPWLNVYFKEKTKPKTKTTKVGSGEHILYINVSHRVQVVYLDNGESRVVKPGGVLSDRDCSRLRLIPSFRFKELDNGGNDVVIEDNKDLVDKLSISSFINKFKPHVIHYKGVNLDFVYSVRNNESFNSISLSSRVIKATRIEGYSTVAAIGGDHGNN